MRFSFGTCLTGPIVLVKGTSYTGSHSMARRLMASSATNKPVTNLEVDMVRGGRAIMRDVVKRVAALLDRQARAERAVADKYACYGWGDSMERQLNDEIINSQY
jgi:hypothetical protein